MNPLVRLFHRRDFKENPARAVWKRITWRAHWMVRRDPWVRTFGEGLAIALPRIGAGAQIHYQGYTEPETAKFVQRFLNAGMVFWDVGGHLGEYTLIAARAVGPGGEVHVFEPDHRMVGFLSANVKLNGFTNVVVNECAVSARAGTAEFEIREEPAVSSLRPADAAARQPLWAIARAVQVSTISLDEYAAGRKPPALIKVDVEGAELLVFEGSEHLLGLPPESAPVWIFEYSRETYPRFGFTNATILERLRRHGYEPRMIIGSGSTIPFEERPGLPGTFNLVACKDRGRLPI